MNFAQSPCKICGKPATAKWDNDATQEAVDKWIKMLAHDACVDRQRKLNDAEHVINHVCFRIRSFPMDTEAMRTAKAALIEKMRGPLARATRAYAEALQESLGAPEIIWSSSFVDRLVETPEAAGSILGRYRAEVKRTAVEARRQTV